MAAIDIGPAAIARVAGQGNTGLTFIDLENPADGTGKITTFYLYVDKNATGVKVGTFYSGGGLNYTNRDGETIGAVTAGSQQSFSGLDCSVTTGDFAGIYFATGILEQDNSGGSGLYYDDGDQFGTGIQTYTLLDADGILSVYGTGASLDPQIVTPSTLALVLTEFAPTVLTPRVVIPTTLALTLTEFIPVIALSDNQSVTPTTLALTLTEYAPTALTPRVVTPTTLALVLTEFAPTVPIGTVVIPTTLALSLTEFTPTILTPVVAIPTTLALTLATFAPTVAVVIPTTLALSLTTFAPTVLTPRVVIPTTLALILTEFIPVILTPVVVHPTTLALLLTTYAPTADPTEYQVFIGGTHPRIRKFSRQVELRIEARSIANFTVVDEDEELSYQRGQPVTINDFEGRIFGGFIDASEIEAMSPASGLYHHISCIDNHYLADKRLVAESYSATDAGDIVTDIITKYLADEGVTVGNIETGPEIALAIFPYWRASDCFDALAEKSNKIWYIDEYKKFYFVARDTTSAPWDATSFDIIKETARLSGGNSMYRNRQYIRGGKAITTSEQTETFIADGEQVAFTVGHPIAKEPTSIKVNNVAQTMGIKGIDTAKEAYWNKGDATITLAAAPAAAIEVEVKYYGQFNILTRVDNAGEIAARKEIEGSGTGYVEDIADEPTLDDKDASIDSGKAKLTRFGINGKRFLYQVTRAGLKPGMLHTVTYPRLGLVEDELLIESVLVTRNVSQMLYSIVGIQGPEIGSWSKFFKSLADMKYEVIDSLHIGSDQILIILVDFEATVEVSETISEPVITACEFPAADLYPGDSIFPC